MVNCYEQRAPALLCRAVSLVLRRENTMSALTPPERLGEKPAPTIGRGAGTFLDMAGRAVEWLWPGWLPLGKLTLLAGAGDVGKSTLLADLAARVSRGGLMPDGFQGGGGNVIFISARDDAADTVRPRLEAAGANLGRIINMSHIRNDAEDRPLQLGADFAHVEAMIARRDYRLVIIDPVTAFPSARQAAQALQNLGKIAASHRFAVLSTVEAGLRGLVSPAVGLEAVPDSLEDGTRLLTVTRSNLAAKPAPLPFRLEPIGAVCKVAWLRTRSEAKSKLQMAKDLLRVLLAKGPMRARDCRKIAAEGDLSPTTLGRAAHELDVIVKHGAEEGRHCFTWALPPENVTSLVSYDAKHGASGT
jgi:putative DNA primase/helicase